MNKIVFMALLIPALAQAFSKQNCLREITQAEKNECMTLLKNEAIGDLVTVISIYCSHKKVIKESEGGTIYPMLLDECMEKEFRRLIKAFYRQED
jgi:hypothetical protein